MSLNLRISCEVCAKSVGLLAVVCVANLTLGQLLKPCIQDQPLRWAAAFSILQGTAIICMAAYLLLRRSYLRLRETLYQQLRSGMEERLMALALTGEPWSTPVPKRGAARQELQACIERALTGLKQSARDRVARFACQQGFPLLSPAMRDGPDVDRVFRSVLQESLLTRALLAGDLKHHSRYLLTKTIPAVLAENAHSDVLNCLQILTVWGCAMPTLDIAPLLRRHHDRFVFPFVLALLPYVPVEDSIEDHLRSALESSDLDIQCAAAQATGRLKLKKLIPALVRLLDRNRRLALASATAITQMDVAGARTLESLVTGPDRRAAAVAMEALEGLLVGTR